MNIHKIYVENKELFDKIKIQVNDFQKKYLFSEKILSEIIAIEDSIENLTENVYKNLENNDELRKIRQNWDIIELDEKWKIILRDTDRKFKRRFKKLSYKLANLQRKWIKNASEENRMKYYKIFYLWNMWYSVIEVRNNRYNSNSTHPSYNINFYTMDTGIDMIEAEKLLIGNNWNLGDSVKQINYEKELSLKYIESNFKSFYSLLDEKVWSKDLIYVLIILWIFFLIIYSMQYFV